jgi:molybdopterin-containing oxidoreductase family iron-sulfur binding subunit
MLPETVCPVAATSHSRQGQNHIIDVLVLVIVLTTVLIKYVVLTGSCTTKNSEFDYHMNDDLGRMVLNPDVNVRSRGVMEKCSMCIQMTQAILNAKKKEEKLLKESFKRHSNACSNGAMTLVI